MKQPENLVTVIPARGGSKGIPDKNLLDFCSRPLLVWSILQAKASRTASNVYVSSDSDRILSTAEACGAVGLKRPDELATDTATSESALVDALDQIERMQGTMPDLVVFLQATSPIRRPEDIDWAVGALVEGDYDSLFSMTELEDFCIWRKDGETLTGLSFDPHHRGRRQDREPLYLENGSIYVFRPDLLRKTGNRLGGRIGMYPMPFWQSYEIDSPEDVALCRYYFEKNGFHNLSRPEFDFRKDEIELVVYDFDGVMTDNRVTLAEDGKEAVTAHRGDGLGIGLIRSAGLPQMILSTETNPVVRVRAKKLGVPVLQGSKDKLSDLMTYCRDRAIDIDRVLFVGNDINDLEVMRTVGFSVAPCDAHSKILAVADRVTRARGGEGVIRELADFLLEP